MPRRGLAGCCLTLTLVLAGGLLSAALASNSGRIGGGVDPRAGIPRGGIVPASVRIVFHLEGETGQPTPELSRLRLELGSRIRFRGGLPSCALAELYESADPCPGSVVGRGSVEAEFQKPNGEAAGEGEMVAYFNRDHRQAKVLARVSTPAPEPIAYVIPFSIKPGRGRYGSVLEAARMSRIVGKCVAAHPHCLAQPYTLKGVYSRIRDFEMTLHRDFRADGRRRAFVEVGCPVARSRSYGLFPFLRAVFGYADGTRSTASTDRYCEVEAGPR